MHAFQMSTSPRRWEARESRLAKIMYLLVPTPELVLELTQEVLNSAAD